MDEFGSESISPDSQYPSNYLISSLHSVSIRDMDISLRAKNALLRTKGFATAFDIQTAIETDTLRNVQNIGELTVNEIKEYMHSLLKSIEFDQSVNDITVIATDGLNQSDVLVIPTTFYEDLPIDILAEELDNDLINRLKTAHVEKLGELIDLSQVVTDFIQNASKALDRLIGHQIENLRRAISSGKIDEQAQYRNSSIGFWLNLDPENLNDKLDLLNLLTQVNKTRSLTDELSALFTSISDRDIEIFFGYFHENLTLEQVGRQHGVTRERVRQVTSRVSSKLWKQVNKEPGLYFQSALIIAQDMGTQLSLKSWKDLLKKKQIIESCCIRGNIDSFDALRAVLRSFDKSKYLPNPGIADENVIIIINSPSNLSLGTIKAIEDMPLKAKRMVKRRISYIGGIHLMEACDILDVAPQQAANILKHLGYREVVQDWYTIVSGNYTSRWPILKAGLAMMEVCGPLEFDLFCDGIRRYISRFFDVLAPPQVMKAHLEMLGFELEDGYVSWHETPSGYLADSDECFVSVIDKFGSVVTFQEVVEMFREQGFSFASATSRVLPQSPIVEKVSLGLYKIRGHDHTWQDIKYAENRQETIDYNPEVTYGIDGITRFRITLGSWALNGAVSLSPNQQPIPDLGNGWDVFVGSDHLGTARRDEYLIWGLGSAFKSLEVQIGDRVELAFDAWENPKIRIAII